MAGEEPIVSGMAGRYAGALFELALESKTVDAVKADLEKFDALVASSPDLTRLVRSPVFGADEQEQGARPPCSSAPALRDSPRNSSK